jgi:hypothetical protein
VNSGRERFDEVLECRRGIKWMGFALLHQAIFTGLFLLIHHSVAASLISTMRNKKSDYLLIDLDSIDNKAIARAVLPRTERDYKEALNLFDM